MSAYYNEIDPYAAQWLLNLIDAGHIAPGDVDTRSIEDVAPSDLSGYTQCHFFAGIGGWSLALRLAGWPDSRPAWTGSCPCQPFSAAGKGAGFADERHLWPAWQHLIAQCRPAVVFGEQVASKDADPWVDLVHADLEGMGYAFGCVPFPSAGVGAPHIRDRTYWVGDADDARLEGLAGHGAAFPRGEAAGGGSAAEASVPVRLADTDSGQRDGIAVMRGHERDWNDAGRAEGFGSAAACGNTGGMADADGRNTSAERQQRGGEQRQQPQDGGAGGLVHRGRDRLELGGPGPLNGFWSDADWLRCRDGKWRPVEPGTFPLAHGIPNRVGRLRAYGNAINPRQAAEFILAYAEARGLIALERAA